jgi:quinohemoprotein ethanol dehydrogenase
VGKKRLVSRILSFEIGGDAVLPPLPVLPAVLSPPHRFGSEVRVDASSGLYACYCSICHGAAVIGGGVLQDLPHSAMIGTGGAFQSVVLEGAIPGKEMASSAEGFSEEDAETVHAFIVDRANQ